MRVLMINSVCGIRSTGRICTDLAEEFLAEGHEVKIAYGRESVPDKYKEISIRIGNRMDIYMSAVKARLLDNEGFNSVRATKEFLKWANEYNPDLLWLHNLHGYYINIDLLFKWVKSRPNMQVKWTLHDCWAFTGHCPHFSAIKCDKWKVQCENCPQKDIYPSSIYVDKSKTNYIRKKECFLGVKDMTLVTPSNWLANLVRDSYLFKYPIEVQYNKVDNTIFKPTQSDFREKYNLQDKKIVLGVATAWGERKGLNDFIELSKMLDTNYKIVLVGLTKKQINKLPKEILGIERTNNLSELAAIYTVADVFVNPSREETFGMTTVEAELCGTTAIVYKNTACEEIIKIYGGIAVWENIDILYDAVIRVTEKV